MLDTDADYLFILCSLFKLMTICRDGLESLLVRPVVEHLFIYLETWKSRWSLGRKLINLRNPENSSQAS